MFFDAGALTFKIQTVGAAVFQREMQEASRAVDAVGKGSADAAPKVEAAGQSVDNAGKAAGRARDSLGRFTSSTKDAGDESQRSRSKLSQLIGEWSKLEGKGAEALKSIGAGLGIFGGAVAAVGVAAAVTGIQYNQLQQQSRAALTTLLGSAEAANEQMDKLDEFARSSPFSKAVFIQAQQQLLGFGLAAEKVLPTLDAVQNAVAATGGSNDDIRELVFIIAQLAGGVKISAETLNQFGARGIDAATLIGDAMGKTGQQIRGEITAGTLDADAAIQALTDGMQTRFGGAAANVKETFSGAMDRVTAAWRDFGAELARPLVDPNGGGALVDLLNWAADMMRWFLKLPEPIKVTTTALVGTAGAVALVGGAFLLAAPKILAFRANLAVLATQMPVTVGAMRAVTSFLTGPWGIALGLAAIAVTAFASSQSAAQAKAESYADTLEEGTNRITKATRDMVKENLAMRSQVLWWEDTSVFDAAERMGVSLDVVTEAALGNVDALQELDEQIKAVRPEDVFSDSDEMRNYEARVRKVTDAVAGEAGSIERAIELARQKQSADKDTAETTQTATDAYLDAAKSVDDLNKELDELIDKIMEANGIGQDAITANLDYKDALAKVGEAIKANTAKWGDGTQAGRDNQAMLVDLAKKAQDAADKQFALDGKTEDYRKTLEASRDDLVQRAIDLGAGEDAAKAFADQIFNIPSETEWKLIAETAAAESTVRNFIREYNGRVITLQLRTNQVVVRDRVYGGLRSDQADGSVLRFYGNGGMENHVAQMARAGTYRVWAEDETGGESYIPHHPAKRARSEQIMVQTARILGGTYIPAGAQGFADGMVVAPSAPASPGVFTGNLYLDSGAFVGVVRGAIAASGGVVYDTVLNEGERRR